MSIGLEMIYGQIKAVRSGVKTDGQAGVGYLPFGACWAHIDKCYNVVNVFVVVLANSPRVFQRLLSVQQGDKPQ